MQLDLTGRGHIKTRLMDANKHHFRTVVYLLGQRKEIKFLASTLWHCKARWIRQHPGVCE